MFLTPGAGGGNPIVSHAGAAAETLLFLTPGQRRTASLLFLTPGATAAQDQRHAHDHQHEGNGTEALSPPTQASGCSPTEEAVVVRMPPISARRLRWRPASYAAGSANGCRCFRHIQGLVKDPKATPPRVQGSTRAVLATLIPWASHHAPAAAWQLVEQDGVGGGKASRAQW